MKMSSSIPFLSNYVVLITGGRSTEDLNVTDHSAEIFLPHTPHIKCTLPGLPAPYFGHTQEDSGLLCGGYTTQTRDNCRQWNSTKGEFPEKPVHKIGGRAFHISLTPSSENDTVLISGLFNPETSTIVRPGIFDGIPGFRVGPLIYACSIHDPDTDTFVITGGEQSLKNTSLFNLEGRIEYLGDLNHGRYQHGCSSYIADDKRVIFFVCSSKALSYPKKCCLQIFLVTGGRSTDTTEILMNKNKWTVLPKGNLPGGSIAGLGLATVENNVFAFGKAKTNQSFLADLNFQEVMRYTHIIMMKKKKEKKFPLSPQFLDSIFLMGNGTISPITWADHEPSLASRWLILSTMLMPV